MVSNGSLMFDRRTLGSDPNCTRKPPVARPVLPAPASAPASSTSTRVQATLAPITPPPTITTP